MEIETNGYYVLNTNGVQQIPVNVNIGETGKIQSVKNVDITSNGTTSVLPDEGYSGMANVVVNTNVDTDVKLQDSKDVTITSNGSTAVVPDTGYTAIKSVFVNTQVPEPESEASKSIDVVENGSYTVIPTSPYNAMKSVTCNVNVPIKNIQPTKTVSITSNGDLTITPDTGYSGIGIVNVNVNVNGVGFFDISNVSTFFDGNIGDLAMITPSINTQENFYLGAHSLVIYNFKNDHDTVYVSYGDKERLENNVYKYARFSGPIDNTVLCTSSGEIVLRFGECNVDFVELMRMYASKGCIRCSVFKDN